MTPDEIQALREKHRGQDVGIEEEEIICRCCEYSYPCDVIKVLDAFAPIKPCEHITAMVQWDFPHWNKQISILYENCPKCGEQLLDTLNKGDNV